MGKLLHYLSFRGRTNRARFWLTAVTIYAILFVSALVSVAVTNLSPFLSVLFLPVFLGAIVASLANSTRRLHDRAKSAWWLLIFVGAPLFFSLFGVLGAAGGGSADAANFISILGLPFSIWGFVEMGCLRGTTGPNKYGDDPLATPAGAVEAAA